MLSPLPREAERRELMDGLDAPAAELTQSLSDIARLNRIGGTQTMQRCVAPFLARLQPGETLRILDVGTGAADIPLALAAWARRRGKRVQVTALEMHPTIWRHAARAARAMPEVRIVAADGLEPPIRPRSRGPGTLEIGRFSSLVCTSRLDSHRNTGGPSEGGR